MTSIARLIRVAAVLIAVAAVLPSSAGRIPRPKTKTNPRHRVRSAPPRPLTVTPRLKVKGAVASGAPYAASLANALASKKRLRARAGEYEPSVHDFCPIIAYWNNEAHEATCKAFAAMQEEIFYYNEVCMVGFVTHGCGSLKGASLVCFCFAIAQGPFAHNLQKN
jgi:hypothetical protein